jgi:hypothetical protein
MCFSLDWLLHVLILAVVVGAIVKILELVIPWALSQMGGTVGAGVSMILAVLRIIFWAVVVIVVLVICFQLISCLIGYGGGMGSLMPHGR